MSRGDTVKKMKQALDEVLTVIAKAEFDKPVKKHKGCAGEAGEK